MKTQLRTLYRYEIKARFCSLSSWLFCAATLLSFAVATVVTNLRSGYPSWEYSLESAAWGLALTVPFLCAVSLAADIRHGTADLLLRAASPAAWILAKYLSAVTLFAIPCTLSAGFPLLLLDFGQTNLLSAYLGLAAFLLYGAALLALGTYIAVCLPHPTAAALTGIGVTVFMTVCGNVVGALNNNFAPLFLVLMLGAVGGISYHLSARLRSANLRVGICVGVPGALLLLFAISREAFCVTARYALEFLSLPTALSSCLYGLWDISGLLRLLGFTAILLLLSVLRADSRRAL